MFLHSNRRSSETVTLTNISKIVGIGIEPSCVMQSAELVLGMHPGEAECTISVLARKPQPDRSVEWSQLNPYSAYCEYWHPHLQHLNSCEIDRAWNLLDYLMIDAWVNDLAEELAQRILRALANKTEVITSYYLAPEHQRHVDKIVTGVASLMHTTAFPNSILDRDIAMGKRKPTRLREMDVAAKWGHLDLLKEAHQQGCSFDTWTSAAAAGAGHLHVLKWLRQQGCPWDEWSVTRAAGGGFLHVVEWAIANGCPVDVSASAFAASSGHCEVLQHLYNLNIPLHSHLCMFAAQGGHLRVIMWAKSVGSCDCDPHRIRLHAALERHASVLAWADAQLALEEAHQ